MGITLSFCFGCRRNVGSRRFYRKPLPSREAGDVRYGGQAVAINTLSKYLKSRMWTDRKRRLTWMGDGLPITGVFLQVPETIVFCSPGITLYLAFFCVLSFVSFVLRHLCSGTCRRNQSLWQGYLCNAVI